jgi:hypothetical protein
MSGGAASVSGGRPSRERDRFWKKFCRYGAPLPSPASQPLEDTIQETAAEQGNNRASPAISLIPDVVITTH